MQDGYAHPDLLPGMKVSPGDIWVSVIVAGRHPRVALASSTDEPRRSPERYRLVADAAWRWVLGQVRWQDGPWIPGSVAIPEVTDAPSNSAGMHSGWADSPTCWQRSVPRGPGPLKSRVWLTRLPTGSAASRPAGLGSRLRMRARSAGPQHEKELSAAGLDLRRDRELRCEPGQPIQQP